MDKNGHRFTESQRSLHFASGLHLVTRFDPQGAAKVTPCGT